MTVTGMIVHPAFSASAGAGLSLNAQLCAFLNHILSLTAMDMLALFFAIPWNIDVLNSSKFSVRGESATSSAAETIYSGETFERGFWIWS
jgi:hypothetical protein